MAILFATNDPADIPGMIHTTTATVEFDSTYTNIAMSPEMAGDIAIPVTLRKFTQNYADTWTHFRLGLGGSQPNNIDGYFFEFKDLAGNRIAGVDVLDGKMAAQVFGTTTVTSAWSGIAFPTDGDVNYDFHVKVDANILMEVFMQDVLIASATVANGPNRAGVAEFIYSNDDVINSSSIASLHYLSEVIIASEESTIGARLGTLLLSGAGAHADWSANYATLADRDIATGITADTAGKRVSATLNYLGPASSGVRLVANELASSGDVGPQSLSQFVRIGATDYDAPARTLTKMNLTRGTHVWDVNPATGAPWATSDFTGMEVGLAAKT